MWDNSSMRLAYFSRADGLVSNFLAKGTTSMKTSELAMGQYRASSSLTPSPCLKRSIEGETGIAELRVSRRNGSDTAVSSLWDIAWMRCFINSNNKAEAKPVSEVSE